MADSPIVWLTSETFDAAGARPSCSSSPRASNCSARPARLDAFILSRVPRWCAPCPAIVHAYRAHGCGWVPRGRLAPPSALLEHVRILDHVTHDDLVRRLACEIILLEERTKRLTLPRDAALREEIRTAEIAAAAHEHHGDAVVRAFARDRHRIDVLTGHARHGLARLYLLQHRDLVAQPGRILELQAFSAASMRRLRSSITSVLRHLSSTLTASATSCA